jgi:hypothetical protein
MTGTAHVRVTVGPLVKRALPLLRIGALVIGEAASDEVRTLRAVKQPASPMPLRHRARSADAFALPVGTTDEVCAAVGDAVGALGVLLQAAVATTAIVAANAARRPRIDEVMCMGTNSPQG